MELGRTRHVHIVGIGGAGMSAIAELLLKSGFSISGSDLASGDVIEQLRERGATIWQGHASEHVAQSDVVVYSSAVQPESNVEILAAEKQGIPVIKRDEMLGELMRHKVGVCVSGTHGKTSTTAMIATMLLEAGQSPTVMLGGVSDYLKGSTVVGEGKYMVIEADEYDRAFLKLTPTIAVVNSLESEHMDTYGTMENLRDSFAEFANKVPFYGRVICCVDWSEIRSLIPRLNRRHTTFGIEEPADVMATEIELVEGGVSFTVVAFGERYSGVWLGVPGRHNVLNALAAFSVGLELGLSPEKIIAGLGAYTGMRRRFQTKFKGDDGLLVIDDYAHHPSEVKATVRAARVSWKGHRIVAVFQPHLYSRTSEFAVEFGWALSRADAIYVADVFPSREHREDYPGVTGEMVAEAVRKAGAKEVTFALDAEELLILLQQEASPSTLILFMGAGDITHLATRFASICAGDGSATGVQSNGASG